MRYQIEFAESVQTQLEGLTANQRATVLEAVARQLGDEPLVETRNRKLLRPNPVAPWELRVGQLRVFYEVEERVPLERQSEEVPGTVYILAVGRKEGNILRIGGRRVRL
jgi:mRNA-degrading endonuclease RelE of RelBE toxin-antitoxin system